MLGLQDMGRDRMLSSTLAQQQWPALKKETARPFTAKGLVYWGYKTSLLPSTAFLCSSPSGFPCTHLQLVHPSHTVRLGAAGSELSLLSSCTCIPEIPVQKFLNGSGCSQTSNTAFIYKAVCWEVVSQLEPWISFMLLCFLQSIHLWGKNAIHVFQLSICMFDKRWWMKAGFPHDNTTFPPLPQLTIRSLMLIPQVYQHVTKKEKTLISFLHFTNLVFSFLVCTCQRKTRIIFSQLAPHRIFSLLTHIKTQAVQL